MQDIGARGASGRRFAYLSGPAPVEQFIAEMRAGASSYFGTNYMKQFLQLVEDQDAQADIVTWCDGPTLTRLLGRYTVFNKPLQHASGAKYHLLMVAWHLAILMRWIRYRPDIIVVTGNHDYWWVLSPLRLLGARIIPSYHSSLWPKLQPRKPHKRLYARLNACLVLNSAPAIVVTSADIADQVRHVLDPARIGRLIKHLPTYDRSQFQGLVPVEDLSLRPFHVVYTGRIEENKGVFDLLDAADMLIRREPGRYHFHFCGAGTQSDKLRQEIDRLNLQASVEYHGYCQPSRMKEVIGSAHVAVVPTQSNLEVGFEMTCCEATLCGRPLIASHACPALHYLEGVSIAVTPDSAVVLADAIASLAQDRSLFERLAGRCDAVAEQFYDQGNSWLAAMEKALHAVP